MSVTQSSAPSGSPPSSALSQRLLVAAVLLLVAFGGAGLAVAADRPHTDEFRPELTARADRSFEPWRAEIEAQLMAANESLGALSLAGREVLAKLSSRDVDDLGRSLDSGTETNATITTARDRLVTLRLEQAQELPDSRLGRVNRDFLASVDSAIEALAPVPGAWDGLASSATAVGQLVSTLLEHDRLVFDATTAGREARWTDALDLLEQAQAALAEARGIRDGLANVADLSTLDALLGRYAAYDAALGELYAALAGGADPESAQVAALEEAVETTQSALPADNAAMTVIVADAAGPSVAAGLVVVERARGAVAEALGNRP